MEAFRSKIQILQLIVLVIIFLIGCLFVIKWFNSPKTETKPTEGFVSVPHDIKIDYRDDVSDFLDGYNEYAMRTCAVQDIVVDGIAKLTKGTTSSDGSPPSKSELIAAQGRAKAMANGQIFDCITYEQNKAVLVKDPLTIKDLYDYFDDIPDNVGYRLWNSAKFSAQQLQSSYNTIQGTLSAATQGQIPTLTGTTGTTGATGATGATVQGFADIGTAAQPSKCAGSELCPDEMAKEIVARLPKLKADLEKAKTGFATDSSQPVTSLSDYIQQATDLNNKLQDIKKKAESGTLIGSPPPSATAAASSTS